MRYYTLWIKTTLYLINGGRLGVSLPSLNQFIGSRSDMSVCVCVSSSQEAERRARYSQQIA